MKNLLMNYILSNVSIVWKLSIVIVASIDHHSKRFVPIDFAYI